MFTKTLTNSLKRSPWVVAALGVLAIVAAAPGGAAEAKQPKKTLLLAESTSYTQQPIRFGVEKGFFAEQGLDVKFTNVQDIVTGVSTGELTFAFGPTNTYIRAASLGAPIKIVASGFRSKGAFWLIARKGINSIQELKGKTIGTAVAGSGLELYLRAILSANDVDPKKDVNLAANGTHQNAYGSIITGRVDASIIHQPFPALGELEGETKTLARGWDYLPTYHTGVLIAGDKVIADDPDLLTRGLRAYFKSYTYAKANYGEYIPWLQKQLKVDPRAVKLAIEQEDDIWDANPAVDPVAIAATQKIEIEWGNQKEAYPVEKFLDLRFIPSEYVKPFSYPQRVAN
jgi:NitT/TauT family transport system substrate-binding protein